MAHSKQVTEGNFIKQILTKVWKVKETNKSLEISWGQEQLGNVHMPRTGPWDEVLVGLDGSQPSWWPSAA